MVNRSRCTSAWMTHCVWLTARTGVWPSIGCDRPGAGWQTIPTHHAALWRDALQVERRELAAYEEAGQWN